MTSALDKLIRGVIIRLGSSVQVRLSRVRGTGRARCNNAGKFEGEDGLGSPARAPNLPTRFSVGNAS
jgi:hypothetical protein